MLNPIEINFKLDKTIKRAHSTELMIKSHDVNVIEFHISFDGLELTADHTVKVLSVFNDTKSQTNVTCDIVDGKAIYRPDTSIISQSEHVQNYVYVYHGNQSLDVWSFTYSVDLSQIDKTALKVKTVYDQSYTDLLADFEQALQDYKDSLPQASDLRAEVDVVLDKFKVDSDAKLNQYDADAQQVIADNQTAFGVAESGRQDSYEQAEDIRNQASNQAVTDWEQGADGLVDSKLIEMQTDADALINGAIDEFNMRGDAEIADWRVENSNELSSLQTEIAKKANREQEDWITPTLLNGWMNFGGIYETVGYMRDTLGFVHIRGMIKGGTVGQNAFMLPEGYKPLKSQYHSCISADIVRTLNVQNSGGVLIASAASSNWVTLNGISFKAEA